jgi:hypothetical protein
MTSEERPAEQSPGLVRVLKIAVIGMGLMILAGLAAVIWRIVELASSPQPPPAAAAAPASPNASTSGSGASAAASAHLGPATALALELPEGAQIRNLDLSGGRMAIHFESPAGGAIWIVDTETGSVLARLALR